MAGQLGIEPRSSVLETTILPLNYRPQKDGVGQDSNLPLPFRLMRPCAPVRAPRELVFLPRMAGLAQPMSNHGANTNSKNGLLTGFKPVHSNAHQALRESDSQPGLRFPDTNTFRLSR